MTRRLAAVALVALSGCPGPDAALSRAVREYDDALVAAYASSDASRVTGVAAQREADRIRILIDLKTSARLVLESRLESFEVLGAKGSGETATVETRERWRYRDRSLQPGPPPGAEIASVMHMRYALVREGGRWKVASVATVSSEPERAPP